MCDIDQSNYDRLAAIYESGDVPWDAEKPPPEVIAYLATVPPGQALDLGCGYGRAAIYLASLGWEVDAVDFMPEAIAEAKRRAAEARVSVRFHQAEVTKLDFLNGAYDFALDVGCSHNMNHGDLVAYHGHLSRLIQPQGVFFLFARLQEDSGEDGLEGPPGMDLNLLQELFRGGFELEWMERGRTQAADNDSWLSAWIRFRRT